MRRAMMWLAAMLLAVAIGWGAASPASADGQWQDTTDAVVALLEERGVAWTDLDGWHRLDQHEIALGGPYDRARVKVVDRDEMVRVSRGD